ncbi:MAG TPA: tetratricopeptide repeat protein [Terriglobales bacterium]|jgi:tetratricopeptide (TPR) repeat protein|nr:tetratricopeptide repeat protein [Terriglobales bacterium]
MSRLFSLVLLFLASLSFAQFQTDPNSTTVRGIVEDSDSSPASGVLIELRATRSAEVVGRAYTLTDGSFQISGLLPGQYMLTATAGTNVVEQQLSIGQNPPDLKITMSGTKSQHAGSPTVSVTNLKVPSKARRAFDAAKQYFYNNKFKQAASELERALAIAPQFADALSLRAVLHLANGNPKMAMQDANESVEIDPKNYFGYTVLGAAYNASGQFLLAANSLQEAVRIDPTFWQSHFEMAKSLYGQRKFASALAEVDAAAQGAPKGFAQIHLVRGAILMDLHRSGEAAGELQEFLKLDPKSPEVARVQQTLAAMSQSTSQPAAGQAVAETQPAMQK